MIEILLAPQTITLLTSLAPVGAWIAKESGVFAESIAVSTITDFFKDFFKNRITEKQLRKIFINSVNTALEDPTLDLDNLARGDLVTTQHSFKHFINFVNKYGELNTLPFNERREKSIQIFREYIKERVPSISDKGLDKIENHFSHAAFGLINECIRKDPEAFFREGLASLERIENKFKENTQITNKISKNLEILKTTALYYQKFVPEIEGFSDYLSKIEEKIDEIRSNVNKISNTQDYQTILIESIHKIMKEIPFGKSSQYIALTKELDKLQRTYDAIPEHEVQLRLEYSKEIDNQKKKIESFEQEVIRLSETFQNIPIDTERLQKAYLSYEEGDFQRAGELLDTEALGKDQQHLLTQQEKTQKILEEINKQLRHNATEYLIKAEITAIDYSIPKRFNAVKEYYSQSIRSYPFFVNLFNFAVFLVENCQFNDAESLYMRLLNDFKERNNQNQLAVILNNLAILHSKKNEFDAAETEYSEALSIFRTLADANPSVFLPYVAMTLNNLAILHSEKNEFDAAETEYSEALEIRMNLADANPSVFLPYVAMTLYNLASLHSDKNESDAAETEYSEALSIFRTLADYNPTIYQPYVTLVQDNLNEFSLHTNHHI